MDYDQLLKNKATLSSAKVNNGNIDLDSLQLVDDEDAFITAIQKADKRIDGAASVEDVEKQLNSAIEVVDEYMAKLTAVDLPAELKANLVKEIIDYAASLNTVSYTHLLRQRLSLCKGGNRSLSIHSPLRGETANYGCFPKDTANFQHFLLISSQFAHIMPQLWLFL